MIRYADDFIVTGKSEEILQEKVKPAIKIYTLLLPGRLDRPWLRSAFEGLEPYDGNLSRTVLRGLGASNGPRLPGPTFFYV